MKIDFQRISKGNIFCQEFSNMVQNNCIEFSPSGIIIIYGPNGIGKTSLVKVLKNEVGAEYSLTYAGTTITNETKSIFHIILDQNGRNIIQGSTEDFLLGDNIRREYELKNQIKNDFEDIFTSIINTLKQEFGITKKNTNFDSKIASTMLLNYVQDLANNKSKGKNINQAEFLNYISGLCISSPPEYDEIKYNFLIKDYQKEEPIIERILKLKYEEIVKEPNLLKIEETKTAINILETYNYLDECVVCDHQIEREKLLERKITQNKSIRIALDEKTRRILDEIIDEIEINNDPFEIKKKLLLAIENGNISAIIDLKAEFCLFFQAFNSRINNIFAGCIDGIEVQKNFDEYSKLVIEKPKLTDDDVLFIEQFINETVGRKIELIRNSENNIVLVFDNKELLNVQREKLLLSNGEQNFISLAFELLKAKIVDKEIIVLDDPNSSFDSIYKNKIAYAIIKILMNKRQIILTHTTDLIRLLEHQQINCFNLYQLNNTEGEINGFIQINKNEQNILLYLHKLLGLFRSGISSFIKDEKLFIISAIPFMRGYCQLIDDKVSRDRLTSLMHGYKKEKINITEIYNKIFNTQIINGVYSISAEDIISLENIDAQIVSAKDFPLLNKTLFHNLNYLQLRLTVEKVLVDKYSINTNKFETLSQIVLKAFNQSDEISITRIPRQLIKTPIINRVLI